LSPPGLGWHSGRNDWTTYALRAHLLSSAKAWAGGAKGEAMRTRGITAGERRVAVWGTPGSARARFPRGEARSRTLVALLALGASVVALGSISAPALAVKQYVPGGSFGSAGSGEGQFLRPTSLAVNDVALGALGDVYVIDAHNSRVERFSSTGTYLSQWDGSATASKSFEFSNYKETNGIAVDNSSEPLDPSAGDVYVVDAEHGVVDQFSAEGVATGLEIRGTCPHAGTCTAGEVIPFPGQPKGVAVDGKGNVWIVDNDNRQIDEFSDTGAFVQSFTPAAEVGLALAVDSNDDVYTGESKVAKYKSGSEVAELSSRADAIAIVPTTSEVVLDELKQISLYGPFGEPSSEPSQVFATEESESYGVAVAADGTVYASESEANDVRIYKPVTFPGVSTEAATAVTGTSATLNGKVDPEGEAISECYFEYGTEASYGETVPCAQSPAEINAASKGYSEAVSVTADVSGLKSRSEYHFRLVGTNTNGVTRGKDATFYTATPPAIENESVADVSATVATVRATINSARLQTSYRVEYGTSAAYGSSTAEVSINAPEGPVGVSMPLNGLQPGTLYHARLVAENTLGISDGADIVFTTQHLGGLSSSLLPDGRVYEGVSFATDSSGAEVFPPITGHALGISHENDTDYPVRAAADGEAVAYAGEAPPVGGSGSTGYGGGDTMLATRGADGWEPVSISPPVEGSRGVYQGFSSDLSLSFLDEYNEPLAPEAPSPCVVLYSHGGGAFRPVLTSTETPGNCGRPVFAGVSADDSSVIFESEARLTPEALEGGEGEKNLYESTGGGVYQVNVLPEGKHEVNAAYGGFAYPRDFGGAINANGSHVVWTDLNTHTLYVREDPASSSANTVLVAEGAAFMGASSDGSEVFFTDERKLTPGSSAENGAPDLYECRLEAEGQPCKLTDLSVDSHTGQAADVLGVLGNSEDGSYVYFVADGELAPNTNTNNETAAAGEPNLYLYHNGETSFVATLALGDDNLSNGNSASIPNGGDWQPSLDMRTAEVTPNGHSVVFMSHRRLTSYDNTGLAEVFSYDAESGQVSCSSCNPNGTAPVTVTDKGEEVGGFLMRPENSEAVINDEGASYQLRTISDDGDRVFFDSTQPLVPQAVAGLESVYEWERDGSGSCQEANGCVSLLSGAPSGESTFVDADASGDNVFFTTRSSLLPEDRNEQVDLYDAHVDGGFPYLETECSGSGCQGVPPAPPIFATPSSATFNGVGNFVPSVPAVAKTTKKPARCAKGKTRNKHGKCVKAKTKTKKHKAKAKKSSRSDRGAK